MKSKGTKECKHIWALYRQGLVGTKENLTYSFDEFFCQKCLEIKEKKYL